MNIHVITYSEGPFKGMERILGARVALNGFKSFTALNLTDIDEEFRAQNFDTLEMSRGAGYWLWKPYLIIKHLDLLQDGEALLYMDSGILPRLVSSDYEALLDRPSIHLWAIENLDYRDWTYNEVLKKSGAYMGPIFEPMFIGGAILVLNNSKVREVLRVWLNYCKEDELLRPDSLPLDLEKSTKVHRHDQSLLNIVVREYPELFSLHSTSKGDLNIHKYFNLHRKNSLKYLFIVFSFPNLRNLRTSFLNQFPKKLRGGIRARRARRQKPELSTEEVEYLRDIL